MPNPDVFLSYSRDDRSRIEPLAAALASPGRSVWWDVDIAVGSSFRDAIDDALDAATVVVVVWSITSVKKAFVLDEATRGDRRGVLSPVKFDEVDPPLGFGQLQFANLVGWSGGDHPELDKLQARVDRLVSGLVKPENRWWSDVDESVKGTLDATSRLQSLTVDIQTAVELFRRAPSAMESLGDALREVYQTYLAVRDAIDLFLEPRKSASLSSEDYAVMARGRLRTTVAAKRGHCTKISVLYWSHGGIRSSISGTSEANLKHLDEVFGTLGRADGDIFKEMTAIADSLAGESSAIANLLVAGQNSAARARLDTDAKRLETLEATLNGQIAQLLQFAGELGISLDER